MQLTEALVHFLARQLCLMSPESSASAAAASAAASAAAVSAPLPAATLAALHSEFAAVLLRLAACNGHFPSKRPPDCTWTVLLYTGQPTPPPAPSAANSSPLVRSANAPALKWQQMPLAPAGAGGSSHPDLGTPFLDWPIGRCRIMSLRSIRLPLLHMEVYAEAGDTGAQ